MNIFEKNRVIFETLEGYIENARDFNTIHVLSYYLTEFAEKRFTGYLNSPIIDKAFSKFALSNKIEGNCLPNSILIVYTQLSEGGYMNYVKSTYEALRKGYNVNLLNLSSSLPLQQKVEQLRGIASSYEYIIYFPYLNDPTGILAFSKDFPRPIISVNTCNLSFNYGDSIGDLWLELTLGDVERAIGFKGIDRDIVRYLPCPPTNIKRSNVSKEDILSKYNISKDSKLIYSCGSWHKYVPPTKELNYFTLCKSILDNNPNVFILSTSFPEKDFPQLYPLTQNIHPRFITLPYVDKVDYVDLLSVCDIYLDSYPINGATTVTDAKSMNKPIIALHSRGVTCLSEVEVSNSISELLQRVRYILDNDITSISYNEDKWDDLVCDMLKSLNINNKKEPSRSIIPLELYKDIAMSRENNIEWIPLIFKDINLKNQFPIELRNLLI